MRHNSSPVDSFPYLEGQPFGPRSWHRNTSRVTVQMMGFWELPWESWPFAVLAGFFGALFGSFANVCIYRWPPSDEFPKGRSVVLPASHCFVCKTEIAWYDNIPLLSYLWLRGRCRKCKTQFSARYLWVEAATMLLFVAVYILAVNLNIGQEAMPQRLIRFGIMAAFCFFLVVVTFIDLDHWLILDKMTLPAIPIFYGLGLLLPERRWLEGLVGIVVGYGVVRVVSDGYRFFTGKYGLGYGDGKFLAVVGAWLGWPAVLFSLFGGAMIGTIVVLPAILLVQFLRRTQSTPDNTSRHLSLRELKLPFGPLLAIGAFVYLFVQPWVRAYLAFLYIGR